MRWRLSAPRCSRFASCLLYKVAKDLLKAVQSVLGAIVGLISALIAMLPQIVYAGLVAFGGAWIITNLSPTWIPIALR
jgi:hypothetical protein